MKQIFKKYGILFTTLIVWIIAMFGAAAAMKLWSWVFDAGLTMDAIESYSLIVSFIIILLKFGMDADEYIQNN